MPLGATLESLTINNKKMQSGGLVETKMRGLDNKKGEGRFSFTFIRREISPATP
jgi:hypothetical protein